MKIKVIYLKIGNTDKIAKIGQKKTCIKTMSKKNAKHS